MGPDDIAAAGPDRRSPAATGSGPSRRRYSVPLVIGVTGHRDLVPAELPAIRERVRTFFSTLRARYPGRDLTLMSPLAEGADRLVADEAIALGMPVTVVLPMPAASYARDFLTEASRREFDALCTRATDLFELPLTPGNTIATIGDGPNRSRQYAQAGVFLSAHCHVLLALWDGRASQDLGGTAQVVHFHQYDVMPGFAPSTAASRLSLTDDESDLVYHVVCSRDRPGGNPAPGLVPLEHRWLTREASLPGDAEPPLQYRRIFERTSEFNGDMDRYAERIATEGWPLLEAGQRGSLPAGLRDIDEIYTAADWLAIHFQRRTHWTLRASHAFALAIGITYVSYTDFVDDRSLLLAMLAQMLVAGLVAWVAARGAWQRRYLDYRALAEGLRVQFYWAAAGVTTGNATKFAHDNFLQMQDPELGWIRNVMRVAGTECDVAPWRDPAGLRFARDAWIGDDAGGQLGYYRRRTAERFARSRVTARLGAAGLWLSAITLFLLLVLDAGTLEGVRVPLVYGIGCVLLSVGVRQAYAKAIGEAEIIKQYEFMGRIFGNARRRLEETDDADGQRRILRILGDAALEEHAEWILLHRQRTLDPREVVRLS
jgi:hypothetical protein